MPLTATATTTTLLSIFDFCLFSSSYPFPFPLIDISLYIIYTALSTALLVYRQRIEKTIQRRRQRRLSLRQRRRSQKIVTADWDSEARALVARCWVGGLPTSKQRRLRLRLRCGCDVTATLFTNKQAAAVEKSSHRYWGGGTTISLRCGGTYNGREIVILPPKLEFH